MFLVTKLITELGRVWKLIVGGSCGPRCMELYPITLQLESFGNVVNPEEQN